MRFFLMLLRQLLHPDTKNILELTKDFAAFAKLLLHNV